jgi:hypothetical protein
MFRFILFLTQAVYWSGVFMKFFKKATGPPQQKKYGNPGLDNDLRPTQHKSSIRVSG